MTPIHAGQLHYRFRTVTWSLKLTTALTQSQAVLDCPEGRLINKSRFKTSINYKGTQYCFYIHVVEGPAVNILPGRAVSVAMGLIERVEEVSSALSDQVGLLNTTPVKIK